MKEALGETEICPEEACPFWELDDRAGGRCVVEQIDFAGREEFARVLLRLRDQLEQAARNG
jgi:hypothetical protein